MSKSCQQVTLSSDIAVQTASDQMCSIQLTSGVWHLAHAHLAALAYFGQKMHFETKKVNKKKLPLLGAQGTAVTKQARLTATSDARV